MDGSRRLSEATPPVQDNRTISALEGPRRIPPARRGSTRPAGVDFPLQHLSSGIAVSRSIANGSSPVGRSCIMALR
jgi:hypothetical protein